MAYDAVCRLFEQANVRILCNNHISHMVITTLVTRACRQFQPLTIIIYKSCYFTMHRKNKQVRTAITIQFFLTATFFIAMP
jgi:hypothetical protein